MSLFCLFNAIFKILLSPKILSAIMLAISLDKSDRKSEIRSVRPKVVSFKLSSLVSQAVT